LSSPGSEAGQAVYTPFTLAFYDTLVLGVSFRAIWKCPAARMLAHYNDHVSANHLECGPGTGYFLDRCRFPAPPRLVLIDLNPACLDRAARRLERYRPEAHRRDLLEPFGLDGPGFDSIGLNLVLHCLPGDLPAKAVVFDHAARSLNPGGVIFGATLTGRGADLGIAASGLTRFYNRKRIFCNTEDDAAGLERELARRFARTGVEMCGAAALFWARA
jgi:SAM-dependent methyltransferase